MARVSQKFMNPSLESAWYSGTPPTGTLSATQNLVTFGTVENETHPGAYSGGTYTVQTSGTFTIIAATSQRATYALGNQAITYIYVNGNAVALSNPLLPATTNPVTSTVPLSSIKLVAGNTVQIKTFNSGTAPRTFDAVAIGNYFSITKTGP